MVLKVALGVAVVILAGAVVLGKPHFKRYRVPSASMLPTIEEGDTVNLNGGEDVKVGDIVIFNPPQGADDIGLGSTCGTQPPAGQPCGKPKGGRAAEKFVKRVVGGPGDRIALDRGYVVRNGKRQRELYAADCGTGPDCHFPRPVTVPRGMYYMLGDNRGASDDSRFWGPVPEDWILGRVERCSAIYFFCSPA